MQLKLNVIRTFVKRNYCAAIKNELNKNIPKNTKSVKSKECEIDDSPVNRLELTSLDGTCAHNQVPPKTDLLLSPAKLMESEVSQDNCEVLSNSQNVPGKSLSAINVETSKNNVSPETKLDSKQYPQKSEMEENIRINEINMQMISESLHKQLFKNIQEKEKLSTDEIKVIKENLQRFGIDTESASRVKDVNLSLPTLEGQNIEEHFYNIAKIQAEPYTNIVSDMLQNIPLPPNKWLYKEGWTRYTTNGVEFVDYPLENGLFFDVEVCPKYGPLPIIATAVSKDAWYGWVSKCLIEDLAPVFNNAFNTDMLIPMESTRQEYGNKLSEYHKKEKIIVGHNVAYDRIRIKEQYWLNCTGMRFVDTMSLHICVSGINSYQRAKLKAKNDDFEPNNWKSSASLNNLADVHELYCGSKISKEQRQTFVEGTLEDVREDFNSLMTYCASDVVATYNILRTIFPMFQERFPHPATFAGMLELGCAYLPVNLNWQRYLDEAEATYSDLTYENKVVLARRANEVCKLLHNEKYKEDLWMWDQDWSTSHLKLNKVQTKLSKVSAHKEGTTKSNSEVQQGITATSIDGEEEGEEDDPLKKEFSPVEETKRFLPVKRTHMPGYPAWYKKLCPKSNDEDTLMGPDISTTMQIAPKILNLAWDNYPVHYIREHGWGILVPYESDANVETKLPIKQLLKQCPLNRSISNGDGIEYSMQKLSAVLENEFYRGKSMSYEHIPKNISYRGSGVWCNVDIDNCCYFFKLPHKNGNEFNVGNPLAKDFLNKFSKDVMSGLDETGSLVLRNARMLSYWRNSRQRIMSQLVVWLNDADLPSSVKNSKHSMRYGAILPQVVVSGTLTRRSVESTWMTASNAYPDRIGSELRSMIQAPPGYNIVGADVDSQELWIASIIGDSYYKKIHGATPLGWMTLIGTKSNGTDMHSVTAKAVGISRDHAKVINYARIYGAGQKFAVKLLKQFNPSMPNNEAVSKSRKMFALTKGKRVYKLKPENVTDDLSDIEYSASEARAIARMHRTEVEHMFCLSKWTNGSESAMFNSLEEIATSSHTATPFLRSRLSRALEGSEANDLHLPTKINWVVQSGAVDFLHLMLVSMRWLMKDSVRFTLSFHDEVRYMVQAKYKYNAALAMHITNLLTRSFCASRLGMNDLPMSVAFFTAVEVDTVLRKESSHDCKTPSNPHGLEKGYDIPLGESLNVWQAIEKSGGSVGAWHKVKKMKN